MTGVVSGVVECPHCGEATMPNRLADGSTVCSCAAERELPAEPPPEPPPGPESRTVVPLPRRPR